MAAAGRGAWDDVETSCRDRDESGGTVRDGYKYLSPCSSLHRAKQLPLGACDGRRQGDHGYESQALAIRNNKQPVLTALYPGGPG